jgi:hypothetical protein|tara:strand:- start:99 stop:380 length:282 start_codon:yes stop_codon:yes gene_type:complete
VVKYGNYPSLIKKETVMITVFDKKEDRPSLQKAQELVGGLVEIVRSPDNPTWQVLVNEEGLLRDLPFNEEASKICNTGIVGDVVILKGDAQWD